MMRELRFDDNLLTMHEGIDRQHEAMFAWGRKILGMPAQVHGLELGRAINFLGTYTTYHFAVEESLMQQHAYDRAGPHREQHRLLRAQAQEIQQAVAAGQAPPLLLARVHALFEDWLIYHIDIWDKPMARFVRAKLQDQKARELPTGEQLLVAGKLGLAGEGFDLDAIAVVGQERWHRPQTHV